MVLCIRGGILNLNIARLVPTVNQDGEIQHPVASVHPSSVLGAAQKLPLSEPLYLEQKAHHVLLSRKDGSVLRLYGKLSNLLADCATI